MAAKTKPKPPLKPEERWENLHKHPAGVPGGMGLSPEHHLRNRGWNGHEINEGSGRKTIQYRNHDHPDFVISYGGGTSQKPDHNFRVLYMGTNSNIPKVHHTYSVAEAMNKVEQLAGMEPGHTVMPMTAVTAATSALPTTPPSTQPPPGAVAVPKPRDMSKADSYPEFDQVPERSSNWWNPEHRYQVKEIPDPPEIKPAKAARVARRQHNDRVLAKIARRYGMDIKPEEVADYEGLRSVVAALQRAERETWED